MDTNSEPRDNRGRQTAGKRHLSQDFIWPPGFGTTSNMRHDKNVTPKNFDKMSNNDENKEKGLNTNENRKPSVTTRSTASNSELQIKQLALEHERAKQAIENEMMKKKLQLLEMEHQVREAEIKDNEDRRTLSSRNKSKSNKSEEDLEIVPKSTSSVSFVQNWINSINNDHHSEDYDEKQVSEINVIKNSDQDTQEKSDINKLCETLGNVLKYVLPTNTTSLKNERIATRSIIEKDFPIFDGKAEDWPTFLYQFNRISSLCNYTPEESVIKLQKCLKGEAKLAVSGFLMCPENLEQVMKTLQRRFGRPDQIIETMIEKVKSLSAIREYDMEGIINLSNTVNCLVSTMISLKYETELQNLQVQKELGQKLPNSIKLQWGKEVLKRNGRVDLKNLSEWLNDMADAACYVIPPVQSRPQYRQTQFQGHRRNEKALIMTSQRSEDLCIYCTRRGHKVDSCQKIKSDDVDIRWKIVTEKKLCFSCLKNNHQTMKCRVRQTCRINGCRRQHHKLLHKDSGNAPSSQGLEEPKIDEKNENVFATGHGKNNILLRMVNVRLYGSNGTFIQTVALCDEASTVTLVDQSLVEKLQIKGTKQNLCLQWTNNTVLNHEDSECFDTNISGDYDAAKKFCMKNVHSIENLSLPDQRTDFREWKQYPHLNGLPIIDIKTKPLILIGQDNIHLTVPRKVIQGDEDTPIATKTNLGWILHGRTENIPQNHTYVLHVCEKEITDEALHQLVKNSFTTDAFGVAPTTQLQKNKNVEKAIDTMEKTARRVNRSRFEIGLLWKSDDINLPESKSTAFRRLQCVERQMEKDQQFKDKYTENIKKYIEKGYVRKLTIKEAMQENPRNWYLPHFGVTNPNKPDKLRLVFDAAAKSSGTSLNDNLLAGPDLLEPLIAVLMRFRERKVAFAADVKEMFHQVRIRDEDQVAQRFLWRKDPNGPYDVYQMRVMTFGANCSPTCAQFIKNLNAKQISTNPRVIDAITRRHYVDDYLDSEESPTKAFDLICEVKHVQKMAGFELVSWTTNSKELRELLSLNEDIKKDLTPDFNTSIQRVLGMHWDPTQDCFIFKVDILSEEELTQRPTKRHVLKVVMSIFDPLGLLINFSIRGRMIIQDIWRTGIGWNDFIDEEIHKNWKAWISDLHRIHNMTIPRCYSINIPNAKKIEIHIFCDASKKSFVAVGYLRVILEKKIEVSLIFGKARVAPTKPISIPRLELQAAVLGSRLGKTLKEELSIPIDKTYYWSDSTTVLYWITNNTKNLGQFEAHRVGEILELTDATDWYWITSKMNGADIATRTYNEDGSNITSFHDWFSGPKFLSEIENETTWPAKECFLEKHMKEKETILTTIDDGEEQENYYLPDIERFSDWHKLMRTTAYVLRIAKVWISKIRKTNCKRYITLEDLRHAETLWVKQCQKEAFCEEMKLIKNKKTVQKQSKIKNLSPELNKQGILVINGRLNLAPTIDDSTKYPAILPKKHRFTDLFLKNIHEKYAHQGKELVFNEARQKYWIIQGRSAVKSIFAKCQKCRIYKAKPNIPLMAPLPVERLTPYVKPFSYTGIDYFGPLKVTVGRRSEKRWGVIFTCLTVRAIHLEVAHSLTTDSTIMAIKRFIARRGQPQQIISDNGTNLRGASEELRKALKEIDLVKIDAEMLKKGIEWKFIPPAAPHMGGIWERLIRAVKKSFHTVLGNQPLRDEMMLTIFTEVEYMVNSRPLTIVSSDPNDFESLTPNHFLIGSSNGDSLGLVDDSVDLRKQWRRVQQIVNKYWQRWIKEYLPTLTRRQKWTNDGESIKEDDIVVLMEDNVSRNFWKLGRVSKLFPGIDGRVRAVEVMTQRGNFKRPLSKLGRIETEN